MTPDLSPELRRRFEEFLARHGQAGDSEFLLPDVVQSLVRDGRARVASMLSTLISRGEYPLELWS